jgi:hypothetical protein
MRTCTFTPRSANQLIALERGRVRHAPRGQSYAAYTFGSAPRLPAPPTPLLVRGTHQASSRPKILLEVIDDPSQVRSTLVVSELPVEAWHPDLAAGDPTLAMPTWTASLNTGRGMNFTSA